ncbi:MAG TPA: phytanoyl-CoA dioxygenase family protein [Stellaceae bacterium]|jgi:ectoine hydroxylase-related dioxygenase (phytanoyl-CoA dioxygenase family)|nr:phytanoyl-CoA dioxygenase family protein [Stellaceae bacterium]
MLSAAQHAAYDRDGFIVVPNVFSAAEIDELRRVTDEFVRNAASVSANDEIYDLEDSHSPTEPRVRRLKAPHLHHPAYFRASRNHNAVAILKDLWGSVRFDTGKLNMKSAGYGAPVEWHQDWAFYPHTNDDLAAVGIMLDDMTMENGPMLVVPGSHKGPIWDHHGPNGRFCGAMDPANLAKGGGGIDLSKAMPCLGKAGSITVHHVRAVHGSATNFSGRERRFLLFQYRAADAWPLLGFPGGIEKFDELLLAGAPTLEPRLAPVPVRLPLPAAEHQGSIYENQRASGRRYFETAAAALQPVAAE